MVSIFGDCSQGGILFSHPVVAVIVVLGLLIVFHELGHFLSARLCGIGVEVFSVGFGPTLIQFKWRGVVYRIAAIPLGGYVKYWGVGEAELKGTEPNGIALPDAPVWAKLFTVFAGPGANFVLAILIFSVMGFFGLKHPAPIIGSVMPDSPALRAGLESGDKILRIGEREILSWTDLHEEISEHPGESLRVEVMRNGRPLSFSVVPETKTEGAQTFGRIGVGYGFFPSVMAVQPDSIGAHRGLEVGMVVTGLSYGGSHHQIVTWPGFLSHLELSFNQNVTELDLEVKKLDGTRHVARISTSVWGEARSEELSGRDLARLLGLTSGNLVLFEIPASLSDHLQVGDHVLALNGVPVSSLYGFHQELERVTEPSAQILVRRNREELTVTVPLIPYDLQLPEGRRTFFRFEGGFTRLETPEPVTEQYGFFGSIGYGFASCWKFSIKIIEGIWGLITGSVPLASIGGPIAIAKFAGDTAKAGLESFFSYTALISINLGLVNLLPVPILDGGQLVVFSLEGLRRKRLSEEALDKVNKFGLMILVALFLLATYNDLSRFWTDLLMQ